MKKSIFTLAFLALLWQPLTLFTADLSGCFGIGYDAGKASVSARYFFGNFGIDLCAGIAIEPLVSTLGDTQTKLTLRCGLYGLYAVDVHEAANLNIFCGAEVEQVGSHEKGQDDINFYARAGLAPEIFIVESVSVEASFGIEAAFVKSVVPKTYRITIAVYGNEISIVSGLAFHWYFNYGSLREASADGTRA